METVQFEPMSVGRIFDVTFNLYRRNFLRFITIVALIQVPIGLITTVWTVGMVLPMEQQTRQRVQEQSQQADPPAYSTEFSRATGSEDSAQL